MTVAAAIEAPQTLIVWRYLWWALAAIAVMIAAIVASNFWLLDFIHVFTGLLWTGIDLFMGFVLGPILRRMDLTRPPGSRASAGTADPVPDAGACDHRRHHRLVSRRQARLHRAALAGLRLGRGSVGAGHR